jgi:hypothetical protein
MSRHIFGGTLYFPLSKLLKQSPFEIFGQWVLTFKEENYGSCD